MGSDEAGINDDKDILQEMRLVLKLHREPGMENTPPTGYQVFQMATVNGAYVCGFGDLIGTLEPGKRADTVLLNLQNIEEPYLDPDVSIIDAVVHRGRSIDVETVMVDGEFVLRDRKLISVDEELLYRELKKSLIRPPLPHEMERNELSRQIEPHLRRFYAGTISKLSQPHYQYNACN
jgi:cytosine/adenosine deaminase-related metal-dependent hydrolase